MTRAQASLGLLLAVFLCNSLKAQMPLVLTKVPVEKCYAVRDTVTGFYGPDSNFTYYGSFVEYNHGKKYIEGSFRYGKMTGNWKKYHNDNGHLCTSGTYNDDGLPHGKWKNYYTTDTLSAVIYYNNGVKAGIWTGFGFNGKKQVQQTYNENGKKILEKWFYNNGRIAFEDSIVFEGEDSTTFRTLCYEDGTTYIKTSFRNAKMFGPFLKYHKNGKLWESLILKDDFVVDVLEMYNDRGKPLDYGTFKNGTGTLKRYHVNGKVWMENVYKGDHLNYFQNCFNYSGVIYSRGEFVNGVESGLWKFYDGGTVTREMNFLKGRDHFTILVYMNRAKYRTLEYKNGLAVGKWHDYDGMGTITSTVNYDLGYRHGPASMLLGEIGLLCVGNFYYGNPIGKWDFINYNTGKIKYSSQFAEMAFCDTALIDKDDKFRFSSSCEAHSLFDYNYNVDGSIFYFNDYKCFEWNGPVNNYSWGEESLMEGVTEIECQVGLMGEVYNLKVVRSFDEAHKNALIDQVLKVPYLKPNLIGGLPFERKAINSQGFGYPWKKN